MGAAVGWLPTVPAQAVGASGGSSTATWSKEKILEDRIWEKYEGQEEAKPCGSGIWWILTNNPG